MGTSEGHQKSIFNTLKVKKKQRNICYPTEFAWSAQNPKKIIRTPNLPIRTYIFPKKYVENVKKEKEPKIRMGATRRNLQAQPKILKKSSKHQIYQSERKFSQKKLCFVP
jgi:hypothetical protein